MSTSDRSARPLHFDRSILAGLIAVIAGVSNCSGQRPQTLVIKQALALLAFTPIGEVMAACALVQDGYQVKRTSPIRFLSTTDGEELAPHSNPLSLLSSTEKPYFATPSTLNSLAMASCWQSFMSPQTLLARMKTWSRSSAKENSETRSPAHPFPFHPTSLTTTRRFQVVDSPRIARGWCGSTM